MRQLKEIDERLKKGGSVTVEFDSRLWNVVGKIKEFNMPLQAYESQLRLLSDDEENESKTVTIEEIDRIL